MLEEEQEVKFAVHPASSRVASPPVRPCSASEGGVGDMLFMVEQNAFVIAASRYVITA